MENNPDQTNEAITDKTKKEKHKSIPEALGIQVDDHPIYTILKKDGEFELRHYPDQLIAKITLHGMSYDYFRQTAFEKLAHYIYEGNVEKKEQIPMTTPVLQHEDLQGAWNMSFILPSEYNLQTAPRPKDPDIVLEEVESYDAAVVIYSGNNKMDTIEQHKKDLNEWLEKQSLVKKDEHFYIAQYDAPFVIPHMKRNEVQVKVNPIH